MSYSRRDIGKMALAGFAVPCVFDSRLLADTRFGGVTIGIQTYSFRSIPEPNAILAAIKSMGFSAVELMSNHAEALAGAPSGRAGGAGGGARRGGAAVRAPAAQASATVPAPPAGAQAPAAGAPGGQGRRGRGASLTPEQQAAREELRKWRAAATDNTWKTVRQKIADTGADLRFLTYNMNVTTSTDEEIDYAFRMAKGLGVKGITSSTQISMARRLVPFVEKYQMPFAFHGHAAVSNPDETSTESTFVRALGVHKLFMANLDIGHYIVAGGDPVAFINKHHERITNLHLKDRTKAVAADEAKGVPARPAGDVPFGQGETPIKDVLQLLKKTKWDITANIEFEYAGDPLVEVPKCIQYCKDALA
jgi:sugar phosphate isomerase/epimerase